MRSVFCSLKIHAVKFLVTVAVIGGSTGQNNGCKIVDDKDCRPLGELRSLDEQCKIDDSFYKLCVTPEPSSSADNGVTNTIQINVNSSSVSKFENTSIDDGEGYPESPANLSAKYYYYLKKWDCPHGALDIRWKPPADVQHLHGFLLNITYSSRWENGSISREFSFTRLGAINSSVEFVYDCLTVQQHRSYKIRVTSLPRSSNNDNYQEINIGPSQQNSKQ